MKKLILTLFFVGLPAMANAKTITVKVRGMVCAFCAQGIEKKLKALPEVAKVQVSLESKLVSIETKDGKDISDSALSAIITDSGYNVQGIERK